MRPLHTNPVYQRISRGTPPISGRARLTLIALPLLIAIAVGASTIQPGMSDVIASALRAARDSLLGWGLGIIVLVMTSVVSRAQRDADLVAQLPVTPLTAAEARFGLIAGVLTSMRGMLILAGAALILAAVLNTAHAARLVAESTCTVMWRSEAMVSNWFMGRGLTLIEPGFNPCIAPTDPRLALRGVLLLIAALGAGGAALAATVPGIVGNEYLKNNRAFLLILPAAAAIGMAVLLAGNESMTFLTVSTAPGDPSQLAMIWPPPWGLLALAVVVPLTLAGIMVPVIPASSRTAGK